MIPDIKIIGSFAQTHCFPRAVAYLDSGKINVKGMVSARYLLPGNLFIFGLKVTDVFKIDEYQQALDKMNNRGALKIIVKP
jgi:D-arabinitol dehydrogenase (NADP+)